MKRLKNGALDILERPTWVIASLCLGLLLLHLVLKFAYGNIGEGLDAVAVGLTAVGLSPWVARVLESFKFGGVEFKFVQKQLDEQSQDIEALKFLIGNYVTDTELDHLDRLASGR